MNSPRRARPADEPLTRPFWEAAAAQRLVIQRCAACRRFQHPPAPRCQACGEVAQLGFEAVSGHARVVSWSCIRQALVGGFETVVPYTNVVVELVEQEGLYLVTDLPGDVTGPDSPMAVGAAMTAVFETVSPGFVLPQFRFAARAGTVAAEESR
ncbi:MAG: Zn-ribbon domain-containing OB-fold protein [Lautropia sp.]